MSSPTTLHYYFVLILPVAATADLDDDGSLVERGIYTDYVVVFKETNSGIAVLSKLFNEKTVLSEYSIIIIIITVLKC